MHYTLKDHQGNQTATIHGNTMERMTQFWRICNPPASNISICNARHLCSNKLSIIFAPKTNMLWEDVIHISGIANPHIQDLRIANPLGRGIANPLEQEIIWIKKNWRYNKNQ